MNEYSFTEPKIPEQKKFLVKEAEQIETISNFIEELAEYICLFGYQVHQDDDFRNISDNIYSKLQELFEEKPKSTNTEAELAARVNDWRIKIASRKIRERDERYLTQGYDEGAYIEIGLPKGKLQLNIVGGMRVIRAVDFRDNFNAAMSGSLQSERTGKYAEQPTDINLEHYNNDGQCLFRLWLRFVARGEKSSLMLSNTTFKLADGSEFTLESNLRIVGALAKNYAPKLKQLVEEIIAIKDALVSRDSEKRKWGSLAC